MRIMGLDYGSKTVGVAISDPLLLIAQPIETIERVKENQLRKTLVRIDELIREYEIGTIVLGLPLNMDDTVGERAKKALEFRDILKKRTDLEIVMQDERLSTVTANDTLAEMGVKPEERKRYIDKIAASYILQDFLNSIEKQ